MLMPMRGKLVVLRDLAQKESAGGIILPDQAQKKQTRGEVILAGKPRIEDGKELPMELRAGDRIVFGLYAGVEVELSPEEVKWCGAEKDQKVVLINQEDVLAKETGPTTEERSKRRTRID